MRFPEQRAMRLAAVLDAYDIRAARARRITFRCGVVATLAIFATLAAVVWSVASITSGR